MVIRNIRISGRRTSVRLERAELQALDRICAAEKLTIHEFCERADRDPTRTERNRTARIHMAILTYFVAKAEGQVGDLTSRVSNASL